MQPHDDEIDLIELIITLWREKVTLVVFLVIGGFAGGLYALAIDETYETTLEYKFYEAPPFRSEEQIYTDIERQFYDRNTISIWEEANPNSALDFDLISDSKVIDGFAFERKTRDRFIAVLPGLVVVKSNNVNLLADVPDYLKFVSAKISDDYRVKAKKEHDRLDRFVANNFEEGNLTEGLTVFERIIAFEEYLDTVSDGAELIYVSRPMTPVVTSLSRRLVFAVSLVIGGVLGVTFVLVRTAFRRRNAAINEASS